MRRNVRRRISVSAISIICIAAISASAQIVLQSVEFGARVEAGFIVGDDYVDGAISSDFSDDVEDASVYAELYRSASVGFAGEVTCPHILYHNRLLEAIFAESVSLG